jgi:hydroxymethylbilane synthase
MDPIRIVTRQSRLALWQSEHVAERLRAHHPGLATELVPLSTRGDEVLDRSLAEIGGKGLFLKELEIALLESRADIAVHSLKDVPAESPEGLELAVVLERANWADWWLTRDGRLPAQMPPGSTVGTSSLRRQSQLLRSYPQLRVVPIRGNVQTRLDRMLGGEVDAVILAAAGLERLEMKLDHVHPLLPPAFIPAPGQGVIVVQTRSDDAAVRDRLAPLNCAQTLTQVRAERAVVASLGGDCRMPLAAHARIEAGELILAARLCSPDGGDCIDAHGSAPLDEAEALGQRLAGELIRNGAGRILSEL